MKRLVIFSLTMVSVLALSAQNCSKIFPSATVLIKKTSGTHSNLGDNIWICNGLTFEVSGSQNQIFVEKNVDLTISGNDNVVVYQHGPGKLTITGGDNIVTFEKKVSYTDMGTNSDSTTCDTIFVDYTNAPTTNACDIYASVVRQDAIRSVGIFPNPASGNLFILNANQLGRGTYRFYNVSGQVMLTGQLNPEDNTIDISTLKSGFYTLRINSANGEINRRVMVE